MVPSGSALPAWLARAARRAGHWASQVSLVPAQRQGALLPASGASISRDFSASRIEQLSADPLILVVHNIISPAESGVIIAAAQQHGRPMMGGDVMAGDSTGDLKYDLLTWPLEGDPGDLASPLLEQIYDRIDAMCGVGRQTGEVPPKVAYSAPRRREVGGEQLARMPLGLHVDTNAVGTYVTALLYLTTVPAAMDGATVFPCAVVADRAAAEGSSEAAAALLSEQALHTGQAHAGAVHHAELLLEAAEGGETGVSVFPETGKLLLFFTRGDDGCVDPSSWHGGAAVGPDSNDGKWILQLCKEVPVALRGEVAQAAFVSARRSCALSFR